MRARDLVVVVAAGAGGRAVGCAIAAAVALLAAPACRGPALSCFGAEDCPASSTCTAGVCAPPGAAGDDAGAAVDDAGIVDAGAVDAGTLDAGAVDAGAVVDAGASDDAGVSVDAGADADAGESADAGEALDAGVDAGPPPPPFFSDDFESGAPSGYVVDRLGGNGQVTPVTTNAASGSGALRLSTVSDAAEAQIGLEKDVPPSSSLYASEWFVLESGVPGAGWVQVLTLAEPENGWNNVAYVNVYDDGSVTVWNEVASLDMPANASVSAGAWHLVELQVTAPASNGAIDLWIDGALALDFTGATGPTSTSAVVFGVGWVGNPAVPVSMLVDDVAISDELRPLP